LYFFSWPVLPMSHLGVTVLQLTKPRWPRWAQALRELLDDVVHVLSHALTPTSNAGCLVATSAATSLVPLADPTLGATLLLSAASISLQLSHPLALCAASIMGLSCGIIGMRAAASTGRSAAIARAPYKVLLVSTLCQLCFLSFPGHVYLLTSHLGVVSPLLVIRCLQDALILPFWLRAVNHAMLQPRLADRANLWALGATLSQLGLALVPRLQVLWLPAACAPFVLATNLAHVLDRKQIGVMARNANELQLSGTLLAAYMLYSVFLEAVGLTNVINEQQLLVEYAVLDVVTKAASCHLLAKGLQDKCSWAEYLPGLVDESDELEPLQDSGSRLASECRAGSSRS